ncbi:MAG: hypothetical protein AUG44_19925 [Actinobacteria bacterium 13_1_20CM_3_71_11]|nr:MAG: hypothetical protein AUG44_19925 [Actinobacteria bacterium 13_1_20CM_3_71_11]
MPGQRLADQRRRIAPARRGEKFGQPVRVAAGPFVHRVHDLGRYLGVDLSEYRVDGRPVERAEMLAYRARCAGEPGQGTGGQLGRHRLLRRTAGHQQERRQVRRQGQLADQVQARRVQRVQVLHDDHRGFGAGQRPDRAYGQPEQGSGRVPFPGRVGMLGQPGQGVGRYRQPGEVPPGQHPGQPVVRRRTVYPGPTGEDGRRWRARRLQRACHQQALAQPRAAGDHDRTRGRRAGHHPRPRVAQLHQLGAASNHGHRPHGPTLRSTA